MRNDTIFLIPCFRITFGGYYFLDCCGGRALAFGLRNVIRPRVRSYGVSSTVTVSHGMRRIICFCIFPPTYARITIFEKVSGSCTSKMAQGRDLRTFPSTSILSSLGIRLRVVHSRKNSSCSIKKR